MDSDNSDTSIDDIEPERGNIERESSKKEDETSINRSHLLAAVKILEEELFQAEPPVRSAYQNCIRNMCSSHLGIEKKLDNHLRNKTPIRMLTYALNNSIFRHDWSTAARVLLNMLEVSRCNIFVYRTVFIVLFNHPQVTGKVIQEFLNQVFNLRTRPEQVKFLQKLFYLPDDFSACTEYADKFADEESDSPDEL